MPKYFTSSEENPTSKVLRIQHKETGEGPYAGGNDAVQDLMRDSNLPSPQSQDPDSGWDENDIKHLNDPSVAKKFGFKDEAQMNSTFGEDRINKLKEHGYEPTWVDADHIWHGDNKQVFFSSPKQTDKRNKEVDTIKQNTNYKEFSPEEIFEMNQVKKSDNLEKKLKAIKELLKKGMKNGGIGGKGAIKAGVKLPSINEGPKAGNNSATPSVGNAPAGKKNPIKQAEQIQNPDIKDMKMKDAQQALAMKKQEIFKFDNNQQWSLDKRCWEGSKNRESYKDEFEKKEDKKPFIGYNKNKHSKEGGLNEKERKRHNKETGSNLKKPVTSKEAKGSDEKAGRRKSFCARMSGVSGPTSKGGELTRKGAALKRWDCNKTAREEMIEELSKSGYKGYTVADNAKRKSNNTGETTGIHTMNSIKEYGGSGADAAGREAAKSKAMSAKNPTSLKNSEGKVTDIVHSSGKKKGKSVFVDEDHKNEHLAELNKV